MEIENINTYKVTRASDYSPLSDSYLTNIFIYKIFHFKILLIVIFIELFFLINLYTQ